MAGNIRKKFFRGAEDARPKNLHIKSISRSFGGNDPYRKLLANRASSYHRSRFSQVSCGLATSLEHYRSYGFKNQLLGAVSHLEYGDQYNMLFSFAYPPRQAGAKHDDTADFASPIVASANPEGRKKKVAGLRGN